MKKGKAVATHDQSSDSSSSGSEDGGLITRQQRRERLNMPRVSVTSARDQVEADREFAEERLRGSGLIEVPGDEEFTSRL